MSASRLATASLMALSLLAACGQQAPSAPAAETAPSQSEASQKEDSIPSEESDQATERPELEALSGHWVSDDDSQAGMIITGDQVEMTYGGDTLSTDRLDFVYTCDGATATTDKMLLQLTPNDGEPMCYSVLDISDTKLVLSYLGRGNTLSYSRAEPSK